MTVLHLSRPLLDRLCNLKYGAVSVLLFVTSSPPHLKTKTQKHEKHIFDLCDLCESDSCEKGRRSPIEFKADPLDPCPDVTTSLGGLQYPALIATE